MESQQINHGHHAEYGALSEATVRDLILELAAVEEEQANTSDPEQLSALIRREEAILTALRRNV